LSSQRPGSDQIAVYELSGVNKEPPPDIADNDRFKREHNLVFKCRKLRDKLAAKVHAKLIVPWPKTIRSPRRASVPSASFTNGQDLPAGYNGNIATLQIFTYEFSDDAELRIAGGPHPVFWEPAFVGETVNLHIFACPENDQHAEHISDAFATCLDLFESPPNLTLPQPATPDALFKGELPRGVDAEETEDLAPRVRRQIQMGRMRKEKRNLNLSWFETEALGGNPGSCSDFCNDCR
jgi:hypothetical protein